MPTDGALAALRAGRERALAALARAEDELAGAEAEWAEVDRLEERLVEGSRPELGPIERARAMRRVMAAKGLTQDQLAGRLGVGQPSIAKALALLGLPEEIQAKVESRAIPPNTGYELSKVEDPREQARLAGEAEAGRLKRDELQRRVGKPRAARAIPSLALGLPSGGSVVVILPEGIGRAKISEALREALVRIEADPEPEDAGPEPVPTR